jgi:SAM-dependent methyltransferase
MLLGRAFAARPRAGSNDELREARRRYAERPSRNLRYLLRKRYEWLASYIAADDRGVELAAGIGAGRDFIRAKSLILSDIEDGDWLDLPGVDATATPFADAEFDFVVIQNAIHHLAQPIRFFDEAARILRPSGLLLVQDVKCSLMLRALLRFTGVEGYDFGVDPFDRDAVLTDPANAWEANNAVCDLLFDDPDRFHRAVPAFEIVSQRYSESLVFLNSGGVTHQVPCIPLPEVGLRALDAADAVLARLPSIFPMQRSLVLRKTDPS